MGTFETFFFFFQDRFGVEVRFGRYIVEVMRVYDDKSSIVPVSHK